MRSTPTAALILVVAVLGAGCSRSSGLAPDDAVEILVIDGLARSEAECLVSELSGELSLAEVTGLEGDLDSDELSVLYEASRRCQPAAAAGAGGVLGAGTLAELDAIEGRDEVDVEAMVAELLLGGLEPDVAVCVVSSLLAEPDAVSAIEDETRRIDAVVACEKS